MINAPKVNIGLVMMGLCLGVLTVAAKPSYADCTAPAGVSGSVDYDDTTKIRTICDGTNWKILEEIDYSTAAARQRLQIADDTGSCTPAKKGRLRFSDATGWHYCDGGNWLPFESAATSRGYLVQTVTRWNGNLGGLSGADAKCLTELQTTYNWKGKAEAGTLNATRVKAFLCDGTTCNNLQANTIYLTAKANSLTLGGIGFLTDSDGRGMGYEIYLDDGNWNSSSNIWTNRSSLSNAYWNVTPKGANHCSQWTSSSGSGHEGNVGWSNMNRWDEASESCSVQNFLLCIVDP